MDSDFLQQHEVEPPLWFPKGYEGGAAVDCSKAIRAGLTFRPLTETIRDTLAWKGQDSQLRAGLKPAQETSLLQAYKG